MKEIKITTMPQLTMALQVMYTRYNAHCFGGSLPTDCVISLEPAGKKKALGWFTTAETWEIQNEKKYGIVIASDHLDRPPLDILGTLVHEMVHLHNHLDGIEDCSRSGQYHNTKFKSAAEAAGLAVEKMQGFGWAKTWIGIDLEHWTLDNCVFSEINMKQLVYLNGPKKDKNGKKSGFYKYTCPICGKTARTTTDLLLVCGGEVGKPHAEIKMEID